MSPTTLRLEDLDRCFHGIVPAVIATCDRDGTPNVSYVSQLYYVDPKHVALSCQFFNKTRQNLDDHPHACVELYDPVSFEAYRLHLHFVRSETTGPLFETIATRIQAIASHTGMSGIFKLRSADVFEVTSIEVRPGFLEPAPEGSYGIREFPRDGLFTESRALQMVSERVHRARDLEELLASTLAALDEVFGFEHGMILVPDDADRRLVAVATHGYRDAEVGAEVRYGEGLIGAAAEARRVLRVTSVDSELRYGRAVRAQFAAHGATIAAEVPLPGLPDAQSQLAIPLLVQDRLVGVLALECVDPLTFAQWHESFLQVLANQIAMCVDRMTERDDDSPAPVAAGSSTVAATAGAATGRTHALCYYRNDDCVFVDGEYLIRNVPAKILWKILRAYQAEHRTEFSNRELRLDPALGLPAFKDNLESRLILLRKRLEQKCPDLRLVPTKRGRFALEVDCQLELVERETA